MKLQDMVDGHQTGSNCHNSGLQSKPYNEQGLNAGADPNNCPAELKVSSQVSNSQLLVSSINEQASQESSYLIFGIPFTSNDLLFILWMLLNSLLLNWVIWGFLTLPTVEGSPWYSETPVEQYPKEASSDRPDPKTIETAKEIFNLHEHVGLKAQRQCPWWKEAYPAAYEKAMQDSLSIHRIMGLNKVKAAGRAGHNG